MANSDLPSPRYTIWQGLSAALALGQRALEEIRTLARTPGPAGKDGLGIEDMTFSFDGERTATIGFRRGDVTREFTMKFAIPLDRGVWKNGASYERGDGVTWDGSWFIAQCDTTGEPLKTADWRQAAKRGRDGKNAEVGKPNPRPVVRHG